MSLPKFSVNQSLFVNLISVIILIIGVTVLFGMNREIFPNVDFDRVSVTTAYPGSTPADVEKLITVPLEKEIKEVDGIDEMSSSSTSGMSLIQIKIDPDEDNKQKVIRDIESAAKRVKGLPDAIDEDPIVEELTTKQYAVIEVSLSGNVDEHTLQGYAEALEDEIENIDGVAKITKSGYRDREIQVRVIPEKLEEYYVSVDEIEEALAARNISIPAGEMNTEDTEYSVRTTGEFDTAAEIEEVVIRANDSGNWLKIKDVAEVKDSFKKESIIYKTRETRSINLIVQKKESGDAIDCVDKIREVSDAFEKRCPDDLEISYVNDYSFFTRRRLNVLKNNGWFGLILVVFAMMMFLQKRVAMMAILGIPIAFFTTFIVMGMMGITINMISMFGLIIVLGMLVDDGIIVAENIFRYMEKGLPPREAAVKGAEEVMGAVTAAVLTTVASFAPLLFMSGIIGKFIRDIPTVLIIALLASLAEALIILPSHLADFVKAKIDETGKSLGVQKKVLWFDNLVKGYTKVVKGAIKRKYRVLVIFSLVLGLCGFLAVNVMKFRLFPSAGINYFFVRAEAPIGTPLEKTNELILPVEEIVAQLPPEELDTFVTSVGSISEDRHDPFSGIASYVVQIAVYLTPEQDRKRKASEIIAEMRAKTKDIQGFTDMRFEEAESGPPVGKAVEARIRGEDFATLDRISAEYMDFLMSIDGTTDVTWDHKPGKEEILVKVDHDKASLAGITIQQVAKTVRSVFEGNVATRIKPVKAEEETDVTIMFPEDAGKDMSVFENVLIRNKYGNLVSLETIAKVEKVPGSTTISHLDGKRVVTASCNVDVSKITPIEVNRMLAERFKDISERYMGYSVKYGGEQEETMDSLISLLKAFMYAFLIIYLILASFFRSVIQPLIVMLAIPFGLIGVVFAFLVHGMPFSFMAILGIVGLNGIVVNDSIVLVSFINKLRNDGITRYESIVKAGQMRLRPVLLTTITTVGGLSTVAYGIGGKDPFLVPMAMAVCWGIAFATLLTLIVIPCIYSIVDDIALKVTHHSSLIRSERLE